MYCVKCGVELQKGIDKCPLCGLKVYHPDIIEDKEASLFPPFSPPEEPKRAGVMLVLTTLMILPMVICLMIDLKVNSDILWSGYVTGGVSIAYFWFFFPYWFDDRNPVIFFPISMTTIILFVLYISLKTGGNWFLSFALPIIGLSAAIIEAMIVLFKYVGKAVSHRNVIIFGSGLIAFGFLCVLAESLIHLTFNIRMIWWSIIPLTILVTIGVLMIVVASNKHLRASFYKRFFI